MIGVKMRRFSQDSILGPAFRKSDSCPLAATELAKVYGFPYLDYFQQRRGGTWHTVRQILTADDGRQCERFVQVNTGGYRILRVIVHAKVDTHFAFRYKVVCE